MNTRILWGAAVASIFILTMPAAAQTLDGPPALPLGASPTQPIPARDADGRYLTPNVGLSREATVWHVRAALNVAALGCRDEAELETIAQYNKLLATQRRPLAAAAAAVKAQYRARYGAGWSGVHDREMTRLYNYFAQPPAQKAFCQVARDVLREAQTITPARLSQFAAAALPRLEAPFTDFYGRYDAYRLALTTWRERGLTLAVSDLPLPQTLSTAIVGDPISAAGASFNPN